MAVRLNVPEAVRPNITTIAITKDPKIMETNSKQPITIEYRIGIAPVILGRFSEKAFQTKSYPPFQRNNYRMVVLF